MRYSRTILFFIFSLFISKIIYADQLGITISSHNRFAKGGDTASICSSPTANTNTSCDFLDRGHNCATDADIKFFDENNSDPNQQAVNQMFFAECNKPSTSYSGQGIGPQFVLYIKSIDGGSNGELDSCLLLSNRSTSSPTRSNLTVYEDLTPSASTPKVPGCNANEYALVNLQASTQQIGNVVTLKIACQGYFDGQHIVSASIDKSKLHYVPCPQ